MNAVYIRVSTEGQRTDSQEHELIRYCRQRGVQLGRPTTIDGRAAEVRKLKKRGLGLRTIARELRMAPSSVHKALSLSA